MYNLRYRSTLSPLTSQTLVRSCFRELSYISISSTVCQVFFPIFYIFFFDTRSPLRQLDYSTILSLLCQYPFFFVFVSLISNTIPCISSSLSLPIFCSCLAKKRCSSHLFLAYFNLYQFNNSHRCSISAARACFNYSCISAVSFGIFRSNFIKQFLNYILLSYKC